MMKEPVDHILRQCLPWRRPEETITECGHDPADVKTITAEQFYQREKELGKQRCAMLTCMTCSDSLRRWDRGISEIDPRRVLGREIEWECGGAYWRVREDRGRRLKNELLAIEELIETHREEFETIIATSAARREWLDKKEAMRKPKHSSARGTTL